MINTKITSDSLKNHFHYRKWIYVLLIAVVYFTVDLAYTMTEYRPPNERDVEFQLVQGGYVDAEALSELVPTLLSEGQAYDPTLEKVEFIHLAYSGDSSEDMYGVQKYVVMIAAQEGDVWILDEKLFLDLYIEGAVVPLDEYIAKGILNISEAEADKYRLFEPTGETTEDGDYLVPKSGEKHVYACPASVMPGIEKYGFSTEGKCAVIMGYSKNPETSAKVLGSTIEHLSGEN